MITLVKYHASWCGPCKAMAPIMDELKQEYKDRVVFTDVDIDDNPQLVKEHHVRSIPTFVIFKERTELGRFLGGTTKSTLESWINELGDLQPGVLPESSGGGDSPSSPLLRSTSGSEDPTT